MVLGTFGPSPCETIGNLNYIFLLILVVCFETFGPSLCDCWNLKVYFKDSVLWTFGSSFVRLLIFYIEAMLGTFGPSLVRLLVDRIILYIIEAVPYETVNSLNYILYRCTDAVLGTFSPLLCENISSDVRGMLWDLWPLTLCDHLNFKLYISFRF